MSVVSHRGADTLSRVENELCSMKLSFVHVALILPKNIFACLFNARSGRGRLQSIKCKSHVFFHVNYYTLFPCSLQFFMSHVDAIIVCMQKLPKKMRCEDGAHLFCQNKSESGILYELCQRCGDTRVTNTNAPQKKVVPNHPFKY